MPGHAVPLPGPAAVPHPPSLLPAFCLLALLVGSSGAGCSAPDPDHGPFLVVLGVAQDGGYPQAGCRRDCCRAAWEDPGRRRHVASLAIVDPRAGRRWLVDASPDLPDQLRLLDEIAPVSAAPGLAGIFLTHGHVGHYTGLSHLGREVMGAKGVPVHVMPRMAAFLSGSGPWDQLVRLGNIVLRPMEEGAPVPLGADLTITPFPVPHRDEYTETVGFRIEGPRRSVVYVPDIDRWGEAVPLADLVAHADLAFLDGTFFDEGELPGRDRSEIPHPLVTETMELLGGLDERRRAQVRFLHLNHSNPALDPGSDAARAIRRAGFGLAVEGERVEL